MIKRSVGFLVRWVIVAVVLAVPAALIFLQVVGIRGEWRDQVAEALSVGAMRVEIGRLTFSVIEGVVAEDVRAFERGEPERQVAEVGELAVSLNLAGLISRRVEVDSLRVEDGTVAVQFAEDGAAPDAVEISGISAELTMEGGRVNVAGLEFLLGPIRVKASGQLQNVHEVVLPEDDGAPAPPERAALIRRILALTDEAKFAGGGPELLVEIAGDFGHPETIRAERVELRSGPVRWRDVSLERIRVMATYNGDVLEVSRISVAGESGDVEGSGWWSRAGGEAVVEIEGSFDPDLALRMVGDEEWAGELAFAERPKLGATWRRAADGTWRLAGSFWAGAVTFRDLKVQSLSADAAWNGERLFVQNGLVVTQTGEVRVDLMQAPDEARVRLSSNAIPTEFVSLLGEKERELVETMEFGDAPELAMELTGPRFHFKSMEGTGTAKLGRTAMRGYWIDSATSGLVVADEAVRYENFDIQKGSGRGTGSFTYDFGRREVRLDGVRSDLDPAGVLMWIDPRIAATVRVYRFEENPDVKVDGLVHMADPNQNDLEIAVEAPGGLRYELLKKDLVFGATSADVALRGQEVVADVRRAELYGGTAQIQARVSTDPDNPVFSTEVDFAGVDFPSITKLYFDYDRSKGKMSGRYAFKASLRNPSAMVGEGSIRVEEGHVLGIPVFGPLSEVISAIIPGAGHESARLATADFTVADQEVRSSNLAVEGNGFEMLGDGSVAFPSGKLDLTVRINARGIPGLVLFPVSKLLEYQSTGTVGDPQWKPKIVPREFWDVLGSVGGAVDAVGGAVGGAVDTVGGVVGDAVDSVGGAVDAVTGGNEGNGESGDSQTSGDAAGSTERSGGEAPRRKRR